jgi:PKD domain/IPT/TIG domain
MLDGNAAATRRVGTTVCPHARRERSKRSALGARATLIVALSASILATAVASAPARIVHLENGKTLSYLPLAGTPGAAPFDEFFTNLDYNGGPVMGSNSNYAFYWDPAGAPAYPPDYQPGLNRYFGDLAHDSGGHANVDSVSSQYNDAGGEFAAYESHFAGAIIDTDPYPANGCKRATICLTDAQLQAELAKYVAANSLPADLTHEYFLLTPPGVEDCFEAAGHECSAGSSSPVYCAYHGNIPVSGGGEIIYSNDPYVNGIEGCDDGNHPNGKSSDSALQGGLSHEHNESITDPEPNNAWTDIGSFTGEIGDKCRTFEPASEFGPPLGKAKNGAKYNQEINGHFYWYQQEWSNQRHKCMQRLTFTGAEPTATFSSAAGTGNKMTFDATGSTATGGVARYNWQFNDGPGLSIPTETTTPTVSHTFPAAGSYLVALTVFAANGTSIGTAQTVDVGKPPPPTVKRISPKKGPAAGGTSVAVTGTGFGPGTSATTFRFGATPAATVNCASSTSCTVTAPTHKAGIVDVKATVGGQSSKKNAPADQFTYH